MKMEQTDLTRMNRVLRHRLRNFASGMKTTISFLSKELDGRLTPSEMEYFPLILNECDGLTEITTRLNLVFDESPPGEANTMDSVFEKVGAGLRNRFPTASVRFELEDEARKALVLSKSGLSICLEEVLANAVEAAPAEEVLCCCRLDGGLLKLTVTDHGPGTTESNLENLFLPFYTTKARHLGVGLTIAGRIMAKWGGKIEASRSDAGGLIFKLELRESARNEEGRMFGELTDTQDAN